ncbi:MAG: hypothetical protein KDB01_01915 [Planctomycetaceae bacterium]|nr:hypothetical protein [Planctomycetaceae bacterium]
MRGLPVFRYQVSGIRYRVSGIVYRVSGIAICVLSHARHTMLPESADALPDG